MKFLCLGIMILGICLKWNTLLTLLLAGITAGLVAEMSPVLILENIGRAFVANRFMAIFILILPVIGILERHGLRERSQMLISKMRNASPALIMTFYTGLRQILAAVGLQMDGHVTFVWPIIAPMLEASAEKKVAAVTKRENTPSDEVLSEKLRMKIRAMAAASENFGNSYGNLLFVTGNGLLLIKSVMDYSGYSVELAKMAKYALPSCAAAFFLCAAYYFLFDLSLSRIKTNE